MVPKFEEIVQNGENGENQPRCGLINPQCGLDEPHQPCLTLNFGQVPSADKQPAVRVDLNPHQARENQNLAKIDSVRVR